MEIKCSDLVNFLIVSTLGLATEKYIQIAVVLVSEDVVQIIENVFPSVVKPVGYEKLSYYITLTCPMTNNDTFGMYAGCHHTIVRYLELRCALQAINLLKIY